MLDHNSGDNDYVRITDSCPWLHLARRRWRRSKEGELFNASESKPDFYLHETSDWLVLPYEMLGLSIDEIAEHKAFLMPMLERAGVKRS